MQKYNKKFAGFGGLQSRVGGLSSALVATMLLIAARPASAATVVAWGDNTYNQGTVPVNVTNVLAIAAGGFFNLALRTNGTIVAWGDGSQQETNVPAGATNIVAISAGYSHALALRNNGTVYVWGDNSLGGQTNMPAGLNGIKAIAAGGFHSLAVKSNGTVVAWGYNADGETNVPPSATNIAAVAAGYASFGLRSNGTVVAWGFTLANQANVLPTLTNIQAIAAGLNHALALRKDGTVIAWGDNSYFQTNIPFGLAHVAAIGCGDNHSFAIESNGFIYAWGRDNDSQVSGQPNPINGVSQISGGYYHSLALGYLNDNFANRMPLFGTNILIKASNLNSTTEADEPQHHSTLTGRTVWFTWTAPASGGVVITATNTDFSISSPILAVYSGSTLAGLTQLASNSADFNAARAVFTAVVGQTYQIVFAGGSNFGGGEGDAYLYLNLYPPPANDFFANAKIIPGNYYAFSNSFVGASREASEPTHGDSTLGQTLWWKWTAPTNGPTPLSVRVLADAVSFPPGIAVYTGSSVTSLTLIPLTLKTNGMSSDAIFTATPGVTYRIALAGRQGDPYSTAALVGSFRFRLNCRVFGLSITNLTSTTNGAGAVTFNAKAKIQNFGASPSGPLRVSVSAISGLSTTRPLPAAPASSVINLGVFPATPTNVLAGQTVLVPISGIVPAPDISDQSTPIAYGAYAELQEQPVTNQWFTVDETLVTFDNWPAVGAVVGPGGGVIRLDPAYVGSSAFNPLTSVIVVGLPNVVEGNSASYYGVATYASSFKFNFTNTTWLATLFKITNGAFSPGSVTSNTPVTLTAKFLSSGFTYDSLTNITVLNLPPPMLTQPKLSGGNFTLQVWGVSNRVHVIESATNLSSPVVWQTLSTNALSPAGFWNYTNTTGPVPQQFFRAREAE
jgi:Regulator of chromosome condensation (RCC1) repeat